MQFREAKGVIQVLAYAGYDKARRRAKVKLLGSFNRHSFKLTDTLKTNVTVEQYEEIQSYIRKIQLSDAIKMYQSKLDTLAGDLERIGCMIAAGTVTVTPEQSATVRQAWKKLSRELPAPSAEPAPPSAVAEKQAPAPVPPILAGGTDAPTPPPVGQVVTFPAKPAVSVRDALKSGKFEFGKNGRWTGGQLTPELREMVATHGGKIDE
ncbi:MAG: hypothetical protein HQL41_04325 [Alphaproteobacteria bacterium]|nr:hypothetical protein [Alphaproteobacteria bacterium]